MTVAVRTRLILTLAGTALAITSPATSRAQSGPLTESKKDARIGSLIEMLGRTRTPIEAAISPDGTTVAWSVRTSEGTQIHLSDVANPDPAKEKIVTTGTGATSCNNE